MTDQKISLATSLVWYGMAVFLYTEGIQLTAAHSGGRCSDLTQEDATVVKQDFISL